MNNSFGSFNLGGIFPPVTRNLIIINFLVWFAEIVLPRYNVDLVEMLGLHYFEASQFNIGQLFTYMFLHSDRSIEHVFFNMFSLWMFGSVVERYWGIWRYLFFYLTCGLSAAIMQEIMWFFSFHDLVQLGSEYIRIGAGQVVTANQALDMLITVGASGAVFGLLLAFGMLFPNSQIFLFLLPIPIKAKYFVIIYGIAELFFGVSGFAGDSVAHFAHLGGMLGGLILILLWRKKGEIDGPYN